MVSYSQFVRGFPTSKHWDLGFEDRGVQEDRVVGVVPTYAKEGASPSLVCLAIA